MKEKTIEDFNFKLICEYFSQIQRQGPGDEETTLKALSFIKGLNAHPNVIDIACGTGTQTITLVQNIKGAHVEGVDLFPQFADILSRRLEHMGLQDRCKASVGDMANLQFPAESFDLIWCEGGIYNIGFRRGIREWRKLLKKGGYIAVSEATWFTKQRPLEVEKFWDVYPEIDTAGNKTNQMEEEGYEVIATFRISDKCWTESFYKPQKDARKAIMQKYPQNACVQNLVNCMEHEEQIFNRFHNCYGYFFYIGRKI